MGKKGRCDDSLVDITACSFEFPVTGRDVVGADQAEPDPDEDLELAEPGVFVFGA